MLYSVSYCVEGVIGPAGAIDRNRSQLLRDVAHIARTALDILDDYASQHDTEEYGGRTGLLTMLRSDDDSDIEEAVSRVNDLLQAQRMGYIGVHDHDDLFALIDEHSVLDWVPSALKDRIAKLRADHIAVTNAIDQEWSAV